MAKRRIHNCRVSYRWHNKAVVSLAGPQTHEENQRDAGMRLKLGESFSKVDQTIELRGAKFIQI
jgi:hypothetical protein